MSYSASKMHPLNVREINKDLNSFSRASKPTPEAMKAIETMRELQKHIREVNSRIRRLNERVSDDA